MQLTHNTILITGGTSGIGLELADRLQQKGNVVIVCSRSEARITAARSKNSQLVCRRCDISDPAAAASLCNWVQRNYPDLNVLINNAAITHNTSFVEDDDIVQKAGKEIATNFMGPVRLTKGLLPLLQQNDRAAVINVTTGLVYAPRAAYPIYNATKAALHSFSQVLRIQLEQTGIEVIEVLFPVVDTPWHTGKVPRIAISPEKAVQGMLKGLNKGAPEIRVGAVKLLYFLYRIAPGVALRKINKL